MTPEKFEGYILGLRDAKEIINEMISTAYMNMPEVKKFNDEMKIRTEPKS